MNSPTQVCVAHPPQLTQRRSVGFTLMEVVIVMAIIAMLALMAVPSLQESTISRQVKEGMALADMAKLGVAKVYSMSGEMPVDNKAAGIPERDKIVGNLVIGVMVADGAVTVTYGNSSNSSIHDKKVSLRPAVVPDYPQVPIAWVCNNNLLPAGMVFKGKNETDIPEKWLPLECRTRPAS